MLAVKARRAWKARGLSNAASLTLHAAIVALLMLLPFPTKDQDVHVLGASFKEEKEDIVFEQVDFFEEEDLELTDEDGGFDQPVEIQEEIRDDFDLVLEIEDLLDHAVSISMFDASSPSFKVDFSQEEVTEKEQVAMESQSAATPVLTSSSGRGSAGTGSSGSGSGRKVSFMGVTTSAQSVVFLVDHSGSMKKSWGQLSNDYMRKMDARQKKAYMELMRSIPTRSKVVSRAVKKSIEAMPESVEFSVIYFEAQLLEIDGGFRAATDSNKQEALEWIDKIRPPKLVSENYPLVFKRAFEINPDVIFLFTDSDLKIKDVEDIISLKREASNHSIVHVLGSGDKKQQGPLQVLASLNGGVYDYMERHPYAYFIDE